MPRPHRLEKEYAAMKSKEMEEQIEIKVSARGMGEGQRWAPLRLSLANPELAARGQSYLAHGWNGLAWADNL